MNKLDPINITLLVLAGSFIILFGILYLFKPIWVQVVNKNTGKNEISYILVSIYTAIFAVVCAIAALLLISRYRKTSPSITYNVNMKVPSHESALAYQGSSPTI